MALEHVPRCQHVKVNGVQCGSPALRRREHCYFHTRAEYERRRAIESKDGKRTFGLPLLEDANSIQVALMKVIQMLGEGTLEEKKAGLMIYALQTASNNLRHLKLEPEKLTDVVIDEDTVDLTQISGPQWASRDFPASPLANVQRDMELLEEDSTQDEPEDVQVREHGFRDEDPAQTAKPEIPQVAASATALRARPAQTDAGRVMRSKSPAPIVDPEVVDAARRRDQKRKLTRDLVGDEQDSLAATLLRRMGLPVELDEEDARRVEEARRT